MTLSLTTLPHRALLSIHGADCDSFLQGLITQDIALLQRQPVLFTAMLSPQGKFLHDFFIIRDGDARLIDIDRTHLDAFTQQLKRYRLRAKVEWADASTQWQVAAAWGGDTLDINWQADPRLAAIGWRAWLPAAQMVTATATPDDYRRHCLSLGVPDGAIDASERNFVLELGYEPLQAVSYTKGCYVGQEPTARMHYRNILRKCLFSVRSVNEVESLPESATIIHAGEQEIGELRGSNGAIGIAQCRIDAWRTAIAHGEPFRAASIAVEIHAPGYLKPILDALPDEAG